MARLTKKQWVEAEEMYRDGATQREIAEKFGVRVETVSVHMTRGKVQAGANKEKIRAEIREALDRKLKEFAAKKADRQIDTKEKLFSITSTLMALYVRELKKNQDAGLPLEGILGTAKAFKESMSSLKLAREELYTVLEIKEEIDDDELPDLGVSTLTEDEEEAMRASKGSQFDDEDEDDVEGMLAETSSLTEGDLDEDDESVVEEGDD